MTRIISAPRGHLQVGNRVFKVGNLTYGVSPDAPPSLVERQGARRWVQHPHLAEARRHCSPQVYTKGLDIEGIDVCILMPTVAFQMIAHDDIPPEHALAICQVYNDYAQEFASANPERFKFSAWLPAHDARLAAQEARRSVSELGAVGVAVLTGAFNDHLLCDEFFEPLWDELSELRVPLGIHVRGHVSLRDNLLARYRGHPRAELVGSSLGHTWYAETSLAELILGGVLERHQDLRVVAMEATAGWAPWLLWRMDTKWEMYSPDVEVKLSMKPSDYFRRQCYVEIEAGEAGLRHVIESVGDERLLFTTDYPHHDSEFPEGVNQVLAAEGVSDTAKRKILWDNGAKLFRIQTPRPLQTAR